MVGSDFVAIALITVFGAGFIYFSFILPMKQKKNGTWNEPVFNNEELQSDTEARYTPNVKTKSNSSKNIKTSSQRNRKIIK